MSIMKIKGGNFMPKGHGVSSSTHSQSQRDNYSNQNNPNNSAYQANNNNHANQLNPNNDEHSSPKGDK